MNKENKSDMLAGRFLKISQSAQAADRFLRDQSHMSIRQQLNDRHIDEINFTTSIAGLLPNRKTGRLVLCVDMTSSDSEQVKQVARGIAATFHYNLTQRPPTDYLKEEQRDGVEMFYSAFADLWLTRQQMSDVNILAALKENEEALVH